MNEQELQKQATVWVKSTNDAIKTLDKNCVTLQKNLDDMAKLTTNLIGIVSAQGDRIEELEAKLNQ